MRNDLSAQKPRLPHTSSVGSGHLFPGAKRGRSRAFYGEPLRERLDPSALHPGRHPLHPRGNPAGRPANSRLVSHKLELRAGRVRVPAPAEPRACQHLGRRHRWQGWRPVEGGSGSAWRGAERLVRVSLPECRPHLGSQRPRQALAPFELLMIRPFSLAKLMSPVHRLRSVLFPLGAWIVEEVHIPGGMAWCPD